MNPQVRVSDVRFTPAQDPAMRKDGLMGWASFLIDGRYRLTGVRIRRTRAGRRTVSYLSHPSRSGFRQFPFRPIDRPTGDAIEAQVIEAIFPPEGET